MGFAFASSLTTLLLTTDLNAAKMQISKSRTADNPGLLSTCPVTLKALVLICEHRDTDRTLLSVQDKEKSGKYKLMYVYLS